MVLPRHNEDWNKRRLRGSTAVCDSLHFLEPVIFPNLGQGRAFVCFRDSFGMPMYCKAKLTRAMKILKMKRRYTHVRIYCLATQNIYDVPFGSIVKISINTPYATKICKILAGKRKICTCRYFIFLFITPYCHTKFSFEPGNIKDEESFFPYRLRSVSETC